MSNIAYAISVVVMSVHHDDHPPVERADVTELRLRREPLRHLHRPHRSRVREALYGETILADTLGDETLQDLDGPLRGQLPIRLEGRVRDGHIVRVAFDGDAIA